MKSKRRDNRPARGLWITIASIVFFLLASYGTFSVLSKFPGWLIRGALATGFELINIAVVIVEILIGVWLWWSLKRGALVAIGLGLTKVALTYSAFALSAGALPSWKQSADLLGYTIGLLPMFCVFFFLGMGWRRLR